MTVHNFHTESSNTDSAIVKIAAHITQRVKDWGDGGGGFHNRHTKLTAIPELLTRLSSALLCVSSNYDAEVKRRRRPKQKSS